MSFRIQKKKQTQKPIFYGRGTEDPRKTSETENTKMERTLKEYYDEL